MTHRKLAILCFVVGGLGLVAVACVAAQHGDREIEIPWVPPTASAPAGLDIDMDTLAGLIAAKVKVDIAATINAQGIGSITSNFGLGVAAVMSLMTIMIGWAHLRLIGRRGEWVCKYTPPCGRKDG